MHGCLHVRGPLCARMWATLDTRQLLVRKVSQQKMAADVFILFDAPHTDTHAQKRPPEFSWFCPLPWAEAVVGQGTVGIDRNRGREERLRLMAKNVRRQKWKINCKNRQNSFESPLCRFKIPRGCCQKCRLFPGNKKTPGRTKMTNEYI